MQGVTITLLKLALISEVIDEVIRMKKKNERKGAQDLEGTY